MKEYIDLQSAHVTQITDDTGSGAWKVRKNITNEDLFELPGHLSEHDVFTILKFAREYEDKAFNAGIKFGKNLNRRNLNRAAEENIRLSTILDNMTGGK